MVWKGEFSMNCYLFLYLSYYELNGCHLPSGHLSCSLCSHLLGNRLKARGGWQLARVARHCRRRSCCLGHFPFCVPFSEPSTVSSSNRRRACRCREGHSIRPQLIRLQWQHRHRLPCHRNDHRNNCHNYRESRTILRSLSLNFRLVSNYVTQPQASAPPFPLGRLLYLELTTRSEGQLHGHHQ